MTSLPQRSLRQLAQLRAKERFISFVWGTVRSISIVVALLVAACLIDRWIDMYRETPKWIRVLFTLFQLVVAAIVIWYWILRPMIRGVTDDVLAQRVETEIPDYDHRLVTAIQLTRNTARTEGMSLELISILTKEAEEISQNQDFRSLANHDRLTWSAMLFSAPVMTILFFLMMLRFDFSLAKILVQRQLLLDVDIPHHIHLVSETPELWPAGDEVTVTYLVDFKHYVEEEKTGSVRIFPDNLPSEDYPLVFFEKIDSQKAFFTAKIPPSTVNFSHRAWLGDGRTKTESRVVFEPRPVVTQINAWVQLPDYVGKKPDGTPYEALMNQGEVSGYASSMVRVKIEASKPLSDAKLILIARGKQIGSERILPPIPLEIGEVIEANGDKRYPAQGSFRLESNLLAYKIEVKDQNGFANNAPPRRGIAIAPDELPDVALLPERFAAPGEAATDDTDVEGIPVPLGKDIRIAYVAVSNQGLKSAFLTYRVNEGSWDRLPLKVMPETPETGPFDHRKGCFLNSGPKDSIEFHKMASPAPLERPGELVGGGRFDFKTRTLKKQMPDGKQAELEVGDRVEFYIEVFDKNPAPNREPGKSEARIKAIVTDSQLIDWIVQTLQSESRIKMLEEKQRGIFLRPDQ